MKPREAIAVDKRGRWLELLPELEREGQSTTLGFLNEWWRDTVFFHSDGYKYRVSSVRPSRPLGRIARFLAKTIYNPRLVVAYEYTQVGLYELSELKNSVENVIKRDEDSLTQFHDALELQELLSRTASFAQVTEVLQFASSEGDA